MYNRLLINYHIFDYGFNFEPKIDLKKDEICIFGPFLGPNDLFQLFSHHILYPTGPMKD